MTNNKNGGTLAFGIMSKQGLSPEEIAALSDYLDNRVQAFTGPIIDRMDQEQKIYRRDRKIVAGVFCLGMVAVLSLPDQALLNGIVYLYSLIP